MYVLSGSYWLHKARCRTQQSSVFIVRKRNQSKIALSHRLVLQFAVSIVHFLHVYILTKASASASSDLVSLKSDLISDIDDMFTAFISSTQLRLYLCCSSLNMAAVDTWSHIQLFKKRHSAFKSKLKDRKRRRNRCLYELGLCQVANIDKKSSATAHQLLPAEHDALLERQVANCYIKFTCVFFCLTFTGVRVFA